VYRLCGLLVLFHWFIICCVDRFVGYVGVFWAILILDFVVLVGAFSVFGRADTGKPVQNYGVFRKSEAFLEFLGLI